MTISVSPTTDALPCGLISLVNGIEGAGSVVVALGPVVVALLVALPVPVPSVLVMGGEL